MMMMMMMMMMMIMMIMMMVVMILIRAVPHSHSAPLPDVSMAHHMYA